MLTDQHILITGASRGIGAAIARRCAAEGAAVIGLGYHRSEEAAQALAAELGEGATAMAMDLSQPGEARAAVERFCDAHGHIDALINNAGVNHPGLLLTASPDAVTAQLAVNLAAPIEACQAALRPMLSRRSGVIVNISSVAAARPARGQSVYAATKGGLESFTRAIAVEYARKGIRAHAVRPGPIDTDMLEGTRALAEAEVMKRLPVRRLGEPAEVAALVAFLLSDEARFITGAVHTIDGGFLAG